MFKKSIKSISFILSLVLFLQVIFPVLSIAANGKVANEKKFNNENVALEFEDVVVTATDKEDITNIKTYSKDGRLLEEIILDRKNLQEYKVINHDKSTKDKLSIKKVNFEERFGVKPYISDGTESRDQNILSRGYEYDVGRGTVRSHSPNSYYRTYYVDVSYEYYGIWSSGQYLVNAGKYSGGEFLAFIMSLFSFKSSLGIKLIDSLVSWGIAKIVSTGYQVLSRAHLNGNKIDIDVIGRDSRDPSTIGTIYGRKWEITHLGSYYGKILYEGVALDDWGNKSTTYSLIREMYPGLHYEMEVLSER